MIKFKIKTLLDLQILKHLIIQLENYKYGIVGKFQF